MEEATTYTHVKTITEVESDNSFLIHCFSDMNADETTVPQIFKSQVLESQKMVDNVNGVEGELMLSYSGERAGSLEAETGELTLDPSEDDAQRYSRGGDDGAFLMYD